MALVPTIHERPGRKYSIDQITVSNSSANTYWTITGVSHEEEALLFAYKYLPSRVGAEGDIAGIYEIKEIDQYPAFSFLRKTGGYLYMVLYLKSVEIEDSHIDESGEVARNTFNVVANYVHPWSEDLELLRGEYRIEFDTQGRTGNIRYGFETGTPYTGTELGDTPKYFTADGVDAYDSKTAINQRSNGEVQGIDAVLPSLRLQIVQRRDYRDITNDYMLKMHDYTGAMNKEEFPPDTPAGDPSPFTFAPGTLLFLGGRFKWQGAGSIVDAYKGSTLVELNFDYKPNIDTKDVQDIQVQNVYGHNVLWSRYQQANIPAGAAGTVEFTGPKLEQITEVNIYKMFDFKELLETTPEYTDIAERTGAAPTP